MTISFVVRSGVGDQATERVSVAGVLRLWSEIAIGPALRAWRWLA